MIFLPSRPRFFRQRSSLLNSSMFIFFSKLTILYLSLLFTDYVSNWENRVWPLALATGSRTITSNQTVYDNSSLFVSFELVGITEQKLLRSNIFIICFSWVILQYKTEKILQFWAKYSRCAWHVIPAQEVRFDH